MNIAILYGGDSSEHKISIQTGMAITNVLKNRHQVDLVQMNNAIYNFYPDFLKADLIFNALHGGSGEDGTIQSFLDLHHVRYTGSKAKACKIAMDKNISKLICKSLDVPTPSWFVLKKNIEGKINLLDFQSQKFSYPYVVKPVNEGSTFGLSFVNEEGNLSAAIDVASEFSNEILIEEYIPGRELTVGILGNKALPIIEIKPKNDLYDYECKYSPGMSEYIAPADLSNDQASAISKDALKIYKTIGCRHYSRVDFRLNDKGEHFFLEMNTLPGMTDTSLLPKAALAAGLDFEKLIDTIIKIACIDQ